MAVLIGSTVAPWLIIFGDYVSTMNSVSGEWFYDYFSWVEMQAFCIPLCGYGLPPYLLINIIYKYLISQKKLFFNFLTYFVVGLLCHLVGAVLFFISSISHDLESWISSLIIGLPSFFVYLLFFKRLEQSIC